MYSTNHVSGCYFSKNLYVLDNSLESPGAGRFEVALLNSTTTFGNL